MAGERFHMVQNVSMAVHHIGRQPTVSGAGDRGGGGGWQPSLCCLSPSLSLLSPHAFLSLSPPLCFSVSLNLKLSPFLHVCLFIPPPQLWPMALSHQLCKVLNSTLITCPSPGALSNASAPVDFFINGRAYTDEVAVAEELLDSEEAQRGSRFRLDYLPDPQFSTAKREKWIKHHPGEPLTLVIHVRASGCRVGAVNGLSSAMGLGEPSPPRPQKEQDSLGLERHEYRVKIGQVACDIQIVSERVIHCSVNESLGTAEGQLPITVSAWGSGGRGGHGSQPHLQVPVPGSAHWD